MYIYIKYQYLLFSFFRIFCFLKNKKKNKRGFWLEEKGCIVKKKNENTLIKKK